MNDRQIGYIVVLITFLFVGIPLIIVVKDEMSKHYSQRTIFFTGVKTLAFVSKDDPVLNNGVEVGKVKKVFLRNDTTYVSIIIRDNIIIREGYRIEVISKGIMGDRSLIVNTGPAECSIIPPLTLLKGYVNIDPSDAIAYCSNLQEIVHRLMVISEELKNGSYKRKPLGKEINTFIGEMDSIIFSLSDIIGKLNLSIGKTMDTLLHLTENISYYTNEATQKSDSVVVCLQSVINSADRLVTKLSDLIFIIEKIVKTLPFTEDTEKVAEIKSLADNIYSRLEQLRNILKEIQSVPPLLPVRLW
ncbi:MAG: MlaD family protein [Chitinispirillaceae bacterium]|nr:MlaD family protein [Chitinispirillaceae bacterium]